MESGAPEEEDYTCTRMKTIAIRNNTLLCEKVEEYGRYDKWNVNNNYYSRRSVIALTYFQFS